jgi:hypothetical protein
MACSSALAMRARSRSLKAVAILTAGIGGGAMIVRVTSAEAGFAGLLVASLVSGALLAAPAIFGGRAHKG